MRAVAGRGHSQGSYRLTPVVVAAMVLLGLLSVALPLVVLLPPRAPQRELEDRWRFGATGCGGESCAGRGARHRG